MSSHYNHEFYMVYLIWRKWRLPPES